MDPRAKQTKIIYYLNVLVEKPLTNPELSQTRGFLEISSCTTGIQCARIRINYKIYYTLDVCITFIETLHINLKSFLVFRIFKSVNHT